METMAWTSFTKVLCCFMLCAKVSAQSAGLGHRTSSAVSWLSEYVLSLPSTQRQEVTLVFEERSKPTCGCVL